MNRQKEFTEEGRYTPISKVAGGETAKTCKAVWVIGEEYTTEVALVVDDIDGIGTVYTNDDSILGGDTIALTYGEEEPASFSETGLTTTISGGSSLWVKEFDGGEGILPLYLQANSPM